MSGRVQYDDPGSWPVGVRRVFLLMLPLSGPLYLASFFIMFAFALIVLPFLLAVSWATDLWKGDKP